MKNTIILLLFFVSMVTHAQTALQIDKNFYHEDLNNKQLWYVEDNTKSLSFESIQSKKFESYPSKIPNFGFANSSFWLQFQIDNIAGTAENLLLEVKNPNLDKVRMIVKQDNRIIADMQTGDYYAWKKRFSDSKYFRFPLALKQSGSYTVFINLQNSGEQFHAPISIGVADYFKNEERNENMLYGIYIGIIAFALIINVFFYFILKDDHSLSYTAYLVSLLGLQLSLTGIGFEYLWPNSIFLANHANPIFASISIFCLMIFCMQFLKTKEFIPKYHTVFRVLQGLMVLPMVFAWIPNGLFYIISVLSINVITMVLNFLIIPTCIIIWRVKKFKSARFFTVAFIVLIISVFIFILRNFGIIPPNFFSDYGLQIGSAMEVLLLTLAVIDKFENFKTEAFNRLNEINLLKTEANTKLEIKVKERTAEIESQKVVIERKNDEILSSVRYARRIQAATLTPKSLIDSILPEYFIFYQPRDIVSGDFYWVGKDTYNKEDVTFVAIADCTGHGIPGAFLSLIGNNYLKQSLLNEGIFEPSKILDFLNLNVISTLNQIPSDNLVKDGMDIVLISINYSTMTMKFAGANNPIYLVRNKLLEVYKPDKQPIGTQGEEIKDFNNVSIPFQKGDCIYMFTDGYADQIGGELGKKYMYKKFKEMLANISDLDIKEQGQIVEQEFFNWKNDHEQVDDVCVMGIRL